LDWRPLNGGTSKGEEKLVLRVIGKEEGRAEEIRWEDSGGAKK
jgi:hypothetical protein